MRRVAGHSLEARREGLIRDLEGCEKVLADLVGPAPGKYPVTTGKHPREMTHDELVRLPVITAPAASVNTPRGETPDRA